MRLDRDMRNVTDVLDYEVKMTPGYLKAVVPAVVVETAIKKVQLSLYRLLMTFLWRGRSLAHLTLVNHVSAPMQMGVIC